MRKAIDNFYSTHGRYPNSLDELVNKHFIRNIPIDPITKNKRWILVKHQKGGIYDIHSSSKKLSLDGIPYSNW
jgi:general secretion pathway protein G